MTWQFTAFFLFSLFNLFISRRYLLDVKAHGFYRFFAWEFTAALVLLNLPVWTANPGAWYQLVSWLLLLASLFFLFAGTITLRRGGQRDEARSGEHLYRFERTTQLVTGGVYATIRHPMYASLFYLAWGVFFKHISWLGAGLALLATVFLVLTAKRDEAANLAVFGEPYREYMGCTKMFVPWMY